MKNNQKDFDCVDMMHKGAQKIHEETKGMNREQEMNYWKKKMEQFFWSIDENVDKKKSQQNHETATLQGNRVGS